MTQEITDVEAREAIRQFLVDASVDDLAIIYTLFCTEDTVRVVGDFNYTTGPYDQHGVGVQKTLKDYSNFYTRGKVRCPHCGRED